MQSNPLLTAVILAKNEQELIGVCLDSLSVAGQIIVGIDHDSSDQTESIVKARNDKRIAVMPVTVTDGFAVAKNSLIKAAKTPWCLLIDADETVTPALAQELSSLTVDDTHDAFDVPFETMLLGRVMNHGGWQESHVRVFRPDRCQYSSKPVHEELEIPGTTGKLMGGIVHNTHRSLDSLLSKINAYSKHEATTIAASHPAMISSGRMAYEGARHFMARYFVQQGWRDGKEGFIEAVSQSYNVFVSWAKAWELQRDKAKKEQS